MAGWDYGLVKTLHIVMVTSWFAGLFYLPRLFVNLAQLPAAGTGAVQAAAGTEAVQAAAAPSPERARLLGMARRLYRFMLPLAVLALLFGLWLFLGYGVGRGPGSGWMHAKLALVVLLVGYHHGCGRLLRRFERGERPHGERWFRWFNEAPVLVLVLIVALVVIKPF